MGLLSLEEDICQILTDIIMGYVIGADRAISRDRWFEPAERGGYNMLNIEQMEICIKAAWIFKWIKTRSIKDYSSEKVIGTAGRNIERIVWGGGLLEKQIREYGRS
jgi:hypothetical protein